MADDIRWFAGVDWASEIHQVVLVDAHGTVTGEHTFPHGGEGLGAMCDWLLTATGTSAEVIAVAIEVPHGPVVETLMERGFPVHAINPKHSIVSGTASPSRAPRTTVSTAGCWRIRTHRPALLPSVACG